MKALAMAMITALLVFGANAAEEDAQAGGGDKSIVDLASELDGPLPARTTTGVVREVDYSNRQAEISGYVYDFGPPGLPIKIKLADGSNGAFELLQPGMKVRVTYGELDTAHIAVVVEELGDDMVEY